MAVWIATVGGAGLAPAAPGTAGSAVAAAAFVGLVHVGAALFALSLAALTALGIWASDAAEAHFGRADDGRIVIDEVAGQLLTLSPLLVACEVGVLAPGSATFFALVVTGFVAFRVFDIAKPGPVRWAERRFEGGVGVMADDLVAGALGAVVMTAAVAILPSGSTP